MPAEAPVQATALKGEEGDPEGGRAHASDAVSHAIALLWQPMPNITQRFGTCDGIIMQKKVDMAYLKKKGVHHDFYLPCGAEAFIRSGLNRQTQMAVLEAYVRGILKEGWMRTVRGTMNYKPMKEDPARKLMMTNATLTEAVYEAARREPTNPHVVATIQAGIDDCTEYHEDIPIRCRTLDH